MQGLVKNMNVNETERQKLNVWLTKFLKSLSRQQYHQSQTEEKSRADANSNTASSSSITSQESSSDGPSQSVDGNSATQSNKHESINDPIRSFFGKEKPGQSGSIANVPLSDSSIGGITKSTLNIDNYIRIEQQLSDIEADLRHGYLTEEDIKEKLAALDKEIKNSKFSSKIKKAMLNRSNKIKATLLKPALFWIDTKNHELFEQNAIKLKPPYLENIFGRYWVRDPGGFNKHLIKPELVDLRGKVVRS